MRRAKKKTRAEILRETCEETYGDFGDQAAKEEIARLSKMNFSLVEDKKANARAYKDQIDTNVDKIEYLVERIDALIQENAIATHIEIAEEEEREVRVARAAA
jgi:predicted transcriptional regulator